MNKIKKDIIILVIASHNNIYDNLLINYWIPFIKYINKHHINIKVYLLFGNINKNKTTILEKIQNNVIEYDIEESLIPCILKKTIMAYEYVNSKYDYNKIIRTNLSSFFIIDNLIKLEKKLDNYNLYAGVIGIYINKKFCSGAGFWCSKDIIEYIIENKEKLNYNIPDDVAIGLLLQDKLFTRLNRYDIINNINIIDKNTLLDTIIKEDYYHIRIKNEKNRNLDIEYMIDFTKKLYKD